MNASRISSARLVLFLTLLGAFFAFTHIRLAWTDGDEGRYLAISSSIAKGLGQVEEYFPDPQPETITPSGYVWYLAAWIRVFGQNRLTWVRLSSVLPFVAFVACFSAFVLRRTRNRWGAWAAVCVVVFGAFQVQLLRYAWNLMSETNFLLPVYLAFALQEKETARNREPVWLAAVLGALAAWSTLVRPVGVALALAGGICFLVRRRWWPLLAFCSGFGVCYLPQVVRTWCLAGVPFAHMTHYHSDASFFQSVAALASTTWKGFVGYFFRSLPSDLFFFLFGGGGWLAKIGLSAISLPLMWLVSALVALGFVRRVSRIRMAEWFWLVFWPLVCTYDIGTEAHTPGAFRFNPRFLAPVLPLAALYFAEAVDWICSALSRLSKRPLPLRTALFSSLAAYTFLVSLAVSAVCIKNAWRFRGLPSWSPARVASSGDADDIAFARFIETAEWAAAHLPSNAVIASRKPQQTFLFSGLKGFRYDFDWLDASNHDVWQNALAYRRYGPVYLLQDAFPPSGGYGNTRVTLLDPLIAAHQPDLALVYSSADPVTRLWRVSPSLPQSQEDAPRPR